MGSTKCHRNFFFFQTSFWKSSLREQYDALKGINFLINLKIQGSKVFKKGLFNTWGTGSKKCHISFKWSIVYKFYVVRKAHWLYDLISSFEITFRLDKKLKTITKTWDFSLNLTTSQCHADKAKIFKKKVYNTII